MKTKASIEVDFIQVNNQVKALKELAGQLTRLSEQEFDGTIQSISTHWEGKNAKSYLDKALQLQSKMTNSAKNLNTIADNICDVAKKVYDAEIKALQLAEQRAYGGGGASGSGGRGGFR